MRLAGDGPRDLHDAADDLRRLRAPVLPVPGRRASSGVLLEALYRAGGLGAAGKERTSIVTDLVGRLTEEERARINAARRAGGVCAGCGRALAPDEPVWLEKAKIGRSSQGKALWWWVPVGRECATPATLLATEQVVPESCVGCGRGVYQLSGHGLRRATACSKRCTSRASAVRAKERTR
jgi:hypothetical protein